MNTQTEPVYDPAFNQEDPPANGGFDNKIPESFRSPDEKHAEECSLADSVLERQAAIQADRKRAIDQELAKLRAAKITLGRLGYEFSQNDKSAAPVPEMAPPIEKRRGRPPKATLQTPERDEIDQRQLAREAKMTKKRGGSDANATCPICSPKHGELKAKGHSGRAHRFQGDSKKPFTDAQFAKIAAGQSPNPAKA